MNTSSTFTAFQEDDQAEFLDVQPLRLSMKSADLDAFDFMLEDDDEVDLGPMALDSFSLTGSMDMIQEETFSPQHRRGQRDRSTSPRPQAQDTKKQRFSSSTMNFDPPIREISIQGGLSQHERQKSQGDMSMADQSISTSCTSSSNYSAQLQSLAASMKRTEESRRHVVKMKQEHLTPEQQAALSLAKDSLAKENEQVQRGFMAALEQSRRQLGQYLMNTQTL